VFDKLRISLFIYRQLFLIPICIVMPGFLKHERGFNYHLKIQNRRCKLKSESLIYDSLSRSLSLRRLRVLPICFSVHTVGKNQIKKLKWLYFIFMNHNTIWNFFIFIKLISFYRRIIIRIWLHHFSAHFFPPLM
jgi:hypothetical protein